jgi:hypothetical protein
MKSGPWMVVRYRTQSSEMPGPDLLEVRRVAHGSDLARRRCPTLPASLPRVDYPVMVPDDRRQTGIRRQRDQKEEIIVWWADLLWGFWNGLTAWIVFVVHVFGGWEQFPFYNAARGGNWYDFGFLLGAGSPILGAARGRTRRRH